MRVKKDRKTTVNKTICVENKSKMNEEDFIVVRPSLPADVTNETYAEIRQILPGFKLGDSVLLTDLEFFLVEKYKAVKADWRDIDKCTELKGVKKVNKHCQDVFCVSECKVTDEDYYSAYIIKRENCVNPSTNKDDFFRDLFLIVGSKDKKHLSSYYIGGYSYGFHVEMFVLCGKSKTNNESY
ncbi:MAG TPA: hypothetical protein PKX91_02055 [Clostridia bacterium]|nr:hypothetical protein [Clostridia bacterium]